MSTAFTELVRRAAERQNERRRSLEKIEATVQKDVDHALAAALHLEANARAGRRLQRRYLCSRFGVKALCRPPVVGYAIVRPDRSPQSTKESLLRAQAIVEHGGWENVWMALRRGFGFFGPEDQGRMAAKFAVEAMRQSPALWGYFIEEEREPSERVREYALAELAGWLDTETRMHGRTREAVGSREEKLMELASSAAAAWADLQPDEPFYLPNTFVRRFNEKRKKGSLAGRGGGHLDAAGFRFEGVDPERTDLENFGPEDEGIADFEARESARQQLGALMEAAGLSVQQAAVYERLRSGLSRQETAAELDIPPNQVYQQYHNALNKLKRAAGQ